MIRASKRVAIAVAVTVIGLATTGPAFAASGGDGTSNTIQFGVTSPVRDQASQRIVVAAPAGISVGDTRLMEGEGIYPPAG